MKRQKWRGKQRRSGLVGLGSAGTLLSLLAMMILCPELNTPVLAAYNTTVNTVATAHIGSILSVALGAPEDMSAYPDETGTFTSNQTTIDIMTNNAKGYQIFLETADGEPYLVNTTTPYATQKIGPIVGSINQKDFLDNPVSYQSQMNTWGYALVAGALSDTTSYTAVPTTSTVIKTASSATMGDHYNLSFAALVDGNLPGGTYSNTVIITIVPTSVSTTMEAMSLDENDHQNVEKMEEKKDNETTTE